MEIRQANPLSLYGHRKQKGQWRKKMEIVWKQGGMLILSQSHPCILTSLRNCSCFHTAKKNTSRQTLHGQVHLFTTTHQEKKSSLYSNRQWIPPISLRGNTKGRTPSWKRHLGNWSWVQRLGRSSQQEWYTHIPSLSLNFPGRWLRHPGQELAYMLVFH